MASSSSAALSLYEKYTQLNHQLDETREKRSALHKQVQDTLERLEEYETHEQPALRQATQQAHDEAVHWQEQLAAAQEELFDLESKRDELARSRDRLEQDVGTRREKHRMECRNFLAESRAFRERRCPQLSLQLSIMTTNTMDASSSQNAERIARLRAVALANGWDSDGLPHDVLADIPTQRRFEELELPTNVDEIDWNIWDAALGTEDEADEEDILQKLKDFREQRKLFEESKLALHDAKEHLRIEVAEKYESCQQYKEQLETKLQRLSKEVQQLEVDISVSLATQSIAEEDENPTTSPPLTFEEVPTRTRVSPSPSKEAVVNPYRRRRSNHASENSARQATKNTRTNSSSEPSSAPPPPPFNAAVRPRYNSSRKRKSAFGSSMKIGGAEVWSAPTEAPPLSTTINRNGDELLQEMEDSAEDDELLAFSPFHRGAR